MNTKMMTLMLGVAAMLASCSSDDALQVEQQNESGLKEVTITASLPDGMKTRATPSADTGLSRCLLQIMDGTNLVSGPESMTPAENSQYTATVTLTPGVSYTFLFWADNASTAVSDLSSVPYANGAIIAFAGKATAEWNNTGVSCTLSHVVSRISLNTTAAVEVSAEGQLYVEVPATYTAYDVNAAAPTGSTAAHKHNFATGNYNADTEVGKFYVLTAGGNQDLKMRYNGTLGNPEFTISNVPVNPNTHITLSGNVAEAGLVSGTITATVSESWEQTNQIEF